MPEPQAETENLIGISWSRKLFEQDKGNFLEYLARRSYPSFKEGFESANSPWEKLITAYNTFQESNRTSALREGLSEKIRDYTIKLSELNNKVCLGEVEDINKIVEQLDNEEEKLLEYFNENFYQGSPCEEIEKLTRQYAKRKKVQRRLKQDRLEDLEKLKEEGNSINIISSDYGYKIQSILNYSNFSDLKENIKAGNMLYKGEGENETFEGLEPIGSEDIKGFLQEIYNNKKENIIKDSETDIYLVGSSLADIPFFEFAREKNGTGILFPDNSLDLSAKDYLKDKFDLIEAEDSGELQDIIETS